jgi:hypothetical protein
VKARTSKTQNKPDAELNEFEAVRMPCNVDETVDIDYLLRSSKNTSFKAKKTKRLRSA